MAPVIRRGGEPRPLLTRALPSADLFMSVARLTPSADEALSAGALADGEVAAIVVADDLVITHRLDLAQPGLMQSFVAGLVDRWAASGAGHGPLERVVIDPEIELSVWTPRAAGFADTAARLWTEVRRDGRPDPLDSLTTPSIYGNKLRMARTLSAIAAARLPTGSPVLDIMSGTGVVTRLLARRHPVTANDGNPYAALLTRIQAVAFAGDGEQTASRLLGELEELSSAQAGLLRARHRAALEAEEQFFHGELSEESLERYLAFTRDAIPQLNGTGSATSGDLITARYANVYFGVGQAIEIDAIRVAIEALPQDDPRLRDLCLAALVLAACTCNPGPHFAQPRKVNSRATFRDVVERRARSVTWEFEVALRRLASREPLSQPLGSVTCTDWREALDAFDRATGASGPRTVYFDPPYSKLQYSRYYHVLNVLLANNYPPVSGVGRYPPRADRFSSRFEYQPSMARREFEDVVSRCADRGLRLMMSYGERGFVSIEALLEMVEARYPNVDVFSERLRHHSQGRSLSGAGGGHVKEFVILAVP